MEQAAKAEEQLGTITESYKTVQEENALLRQKLTILEARFKQAKKEIKDLAEEHEVDKELITYENEQSARRKIKSNWDETNISPEKRGTQQSRLEKNPSKVGKYMRDSNEYLNPIREEPVQLKSNRSNECSNLDVMLAPLPQETIEINDKITGCTAKIELKRNKMLDPLK
ncbi:unnamed protein product [Sphagnum balticum]